VRYIQASLTRRGDGSRAGFRALKDPAKFILPRRGSIDAKHILAFKQTTTTTKHSA